LWRKERAEVGILGGTGVYDPEIFEKIQEVKVYTPFGEPSDLVSISKFGGIRVAFIPRHGRNHTIPPHRINYRANIWALKELGVERVIAPAAVGSLREDYKPGDFVIADQFIDRTKSRLDSFFEGGQVCHISTADPFCPELREVFINSTRELGIRGHDRGTYVCIEGPRFSTRAESTLFRSWNADVIGMTLYPECALAREAELCYISIGMISDYDVWAEKPVSVAEVIETIQRSTEQLKKLLKHAIPRIPKERRCPCGQALKDALV